MHIIALNVKQVSVRSSASNEDQSEASNAGQYETCLFVDRAQMMESVQKCLDSLDSLRVQDYAQHFELGKGTMNVVVQEMIDSDKAGVLFTASPNKGSDILIEAVKGQGENLVSGQVSAHQYEISRKYLTVMCMSAKDQISSVFCQILKIYRFMLKNDDRF